MGTDEGITLGVFIARAVSGFFWQIWVCSPGVCLILRRYLEDNARFQTPAGGKAKSPKSCLAWGLWLLLPSVAGSCPALLCKSPRPIGVNATPCPQTTGPTLERVASQGPSKVPLQKTPVLELCFYLKSP